MKDIKDYLIYNQNTKGYITEKQNFLIKNKSALNACDQYDYHPKTKGELVDIIVNLLKQGETDLNCIDVSKITDMRWLFYYINKSITVKDIDISEWDVSNVEDMRGMFEDCETFNSDLSKWDVSNVEDMGGMFSGCECFDCDLSKWNVSKVKYMSRMFDGCDTLEKNNNIPGW